MTDEPKNSEETTPSEQPAPAEPSTTASEQPAPAEPSTTPSEQPAPAEPSAPSTAAEADLQLSEQALRGGLHVEVVSFVPVDDPTSDAPPSSPAGAELADSAAPPASEGSNSVDSADT